MTDIKNKSFTVLGAGRSGIAVAKLLKKNGAQVFLSDGSNFEKLKYLNVTSLKEAGIEVETGGHSDKVFKSDIIIKSPGISPGSEIILKAERLNKKICSEIEAAFWFCKGKVIAITGTNGKTTTTILTGEIFKNAGLDTRVCGNVGLAFSEIVSEVKEDTIVILEASSYQLNDIEKFRPKVAVLLNITPDHLDWHGGHDNYLRSKLEILKNQDETDIAVINYDDDILRNATKNIRSAKSYFSISENLSDDIYDTACFMRGNKIIYADKQKNIEEEIMEAGEINIRGNHNLYNSLASVISARAFEIKKEVIKETLKKFKGVEHRIEYVKEIRGIKFFNDSKATNIDSLTVALESFEGNLILILGGRETGNDYTKIDEQVSKKVKEIIAIGETKEKITRHFSSYKKVTEAETMDEAVSIAAKNGNKGDIVLLSPACKSFDMFDSFEHRGTEFKKSVNKLN